MKIIKNISKKKNQKKNILKKLKENQILKKLKLKSY